MQINGRGSHIGAVARQTGFSIDTIRFYEKQNLIKAPPRDLGGYRVFSSEEIRRLRFIAKARHLGFSLKEIRQLLHIENTQLGACNDTASLLQGKLTEVHKELERLLKLESFLKEALSECRKKMGKNGRPACHCPVLDKIGG